MPASKRSRQNIERLKQGGPSTKLPGTDTKVYLPGKAALLWYAGVGTMAAAELIEWPIALLIAGTHFIEHHTHNQDIAELADGIGAGA